MATPIRMPDLGTTVEEFRLMSWLVAEGDVIELGDALAEIETDKAVTQLESPAKGVLLRLLADAGDTVYTGDVLAYVGVAGEEIPTEAAPAKKAAEPAVTAEPVLQLSGKPLQVSPIVRNLAAHLQVDLAAVQGSGQGGVITREDVQRASSGLPAAAPVAQTLSRGQAAVARAVTKSWTEIPHIFMSASVDMSAALRLREEQKARGRKLSYDAIFLLAMAQACQAYPVTAAHLEGEQIITPAEINLAIAVGVENDLFLPVMRNVDRRSLAEIQSEIEAIAGQVKAGTLSADRMAGACMAMSNLGMYPVETFDPIIFPGHSIMLAIGAVQPQPVVIDNGIFVRPICQIRVAADHRLVNGRLAAAFTAKLKEIIEGIS